MASARFNSLWSCTASDGLVSTSTVLVGMYRSNWMDPFEVVKSLLGSEASEVDEDDDDDSDDGFRAGVGVLVLALRPGVADGGRDEADDRRDDDWDFVLPEIGDGANDADPERELLLLFNLEDFFFEDDWAAAVVESDSIKYSYALEA